jgi:hypothetical protein
MALHRAKPEEIRSGPGPEPAEDRRWTSPDSHTRSTPDRMERRRLAVHDRDVDDVIRTHARDRRVAARLRETAEGLAEIGEIGLAIDWAEQATDFDRQPSSGRPARLRFHVAR